MRYPIGVQSFDQLREEGFVYVLRRPIARLGFGLWCWWMNTTSLCLM